ncbi:MAG: replication-associated recombination protein A [Lentisphaerae bacterium]|nr:replication-associated recombination protein A [Lentisphaerota bacterium]
MDLFDQEEPGNDRLQPLAARMRPRDLDEVVGQDRILGPGKLLRRAIEADRLGSVILYGPPGSGKTSIGAVIARTTSRDFELTSGVTANAAALREIFKKAKYLRDHHKRETILFVDEIHRFNKAQQDLLLPWVEDGTVTLIGATTHNPMFFINGPLTSRSLVFQLDPLSAEAVLVLLRRAVAEDRGMASFRADADENALEHLARVCDGDGRRALNALETAVLTTPPGEKGRIRVTREVAADSIQKKIVLYDRDEDGHYDTISAFIKSVRGSDPNASVYWLAKMLHAGEDPRFVARRLIILASEDIGNADPRALDVAVSAMQATDFVGMPESRIILAQATTYLATSPKSNSSYLAIAKAQTDVEEGRTLPVPEHLKNVKMKSADSDGDGKEYVYPHDFAGHFVEQEYAPTSATYYEPTEQGYEEVIGKRLARWRAGRETT